jgi:hypothetical protein
MSMMEVALHEMRAYTWSCPFCNDVNRIWNDDMDAEVECRSCGKTGTVTRCVYTNGAVVGTSKERP